MKQIGGKVKKKWGLKNFNENFNICGRQRRRRPGGGGGGGKCNSSQ